MEMDDKHKKVTITFSYLEAERVWVQLAILLELHAESGSSQKNKETIELKEKLDEYTNS